MRVARFASVLSVVVGVACGGHDGTRFTGSAMDDAAADSSAQLTLVLWPATDSAFVGHLQAERPVEIEGTLHAWHDKDGLVMYNIASNGDTTTWRSRLSGAEIGGQYEVTGGPHSGQGGTWRARLQDGPPPSAETLRRHARSAWIPPLDAIWPGMIVAVLLVLVVQWVRRAPEITIDPQVDAFEDHRVAGWLALFAAGQTVGLLVMLTRSVHFLDFIDQGTWRIGAVVPGLRGLLAIEKLMFLVQLVAPAVGLYLIAKRSRFAPRYWFAYLAAVGTFAAFDTGTGLWVEHVVDRIFPSGGSDDQTRQGTHAMNLRAVLISILWCCYWARSTRVRARFGQRALDEVPASVPVVAEPALGD
jgi:hypothetical protein